MNDTEYIKNLLRTVYDIFLDDFYEGQSEPNEHYLPYDFDFLKQKKLSLHAREIIRHELVELTNTLNSWQESLQKWSIWNNIILTYSEIDAWSIRNEFMDKNTHFCLMQPSRIRDLITTVATNSFHQVLLCKKKDHRDHLFGEKTHPDEKPKFLKRAQKEKRMQDLFGKINLNSFFIENHIKLNTGDYESQTSDYRNLFCHSIPPRFSEGLTRIVERDIVQATKMVEQLDGTYSEELIPDKVAVRYSFGGTLPLQLDEMFYLNLSQYKIARTCYDEYFKIIINI